MNSLDDFLAKFATTAPKDFLESFTKWVPPVDVSDQKGSIVIRAGIYTSIFSFKYTHTLLYRCARSTEERPFC